ncbi:MAG TPA: TlpA disulfide reductase family protein [Kofleriaceae bacterium]|nr:TlpA disulfide reductase family protein [Kofleriaceae bacterium]
MSSFRKVLLFSSAAAITLVLGVAFLVLLPKAQANEVRAACQGLRPNPLNKRLGALPTRAPDFTAQDHTGKMVKLSDFRGKVVLVRFWASWCETCKAEQPSLEELAGDVDPDDVVVLSIASDPDWEKVRKKLPGGSEAEVLLDPPPSEDSLIGRIAGAYGVEKVPESFLIDQDGIVRYYIVNKRDWRNTAARTCLRSILDGQT